MEKGLFTDILSRFGELSEKEWNDIQLVVGEYPYCQALEVLMARISRDLQHPDQQTYLHRAAMYSTDRQVLKEVMIAPGRAKIKNFDSPPKAIHEAANKIEDQEKYSLSKEVSNGDKITPQEDFSKISENPVPEEIEVGSAPPDTEPVSSEVEEEHLSPTDRTKEEESQSSIDETKEEESQSSIDETREEESQSSIDETKEEESQSSIDAREEESQSSIDETKEEESQSSIDETKEEESQSSIDEAKEENPPSSAGLTRDDNPQSSLNWTKKEKSKSSTARKKKAKPQTSPDRTNEDTSVSSPDQGMEDSTRAALTPAQSEEFLVNIQKDIDDLRRSKGNYEEVASHVHPEEWKEEQEKANRLLEEADQAEGSESAPAEIPVPAPAENSAPEPKSKKKRLTDPTDDLLDEIKSKKEITPSSDTQKEQAEIIESFMRKSPQVTPVGRRQKGGITPADEALSSVLRKDVASETLVEILVEQGKIDLAVETLKKLIWKYPHKKTYFAARIQYLTGKG